MNRQVNSRDFAHALARGTNLLPKMTVEVIMPLDIPPRFLLAGISSSVQSGAQPFLSLLGNWSLDKTLSIREGQ